jgi:glutathione S-transferase
MPRPDLAALGVQYRRIPVLAIGKDVYCDTRLILQKLEELFPQGALGAQDADGKALERLLEIWSTDGGVFARAVQLIPPDSPLTSDPKFRKDREDFGGGRSWARENILRGRPEAMVHMKQAFELIETTLLADGRAWIRKMTEPTLADIQGSYPSCET